MADFWGSVGNWFGNMTGVNQANQAADQNAAGMGAAQQGGATMGAAAGTAGQLAGKSAGQFAGEAGQAGQALGEQMGRTAATQGTQAATQAARTSGVNKGQAALLGSQQAGNAFTNAQTAGQQLGMGAYGQGANTQLGAVGTQGNIGAQQGQLGTNLISAGQGAAKQGTDAGGGLLSAIGGLISSDENAKKDIKAAPDLKETTKKVTPSAFKYKDDPEEKEQVGVMAQDLEKTPMASNVVDTPEGKMVDTGRQEMSNTALILQLAKKVEELEAKLKGGKDA
jgi:hypothetical protein